MNALLGAEFSWEWSKESAWCGTLGGWCCRNDIGWTHKVKPLTLACWKMRIPEVGREQKAENVSQPPKKYFSGADSSWSFLSLEIRGSYRWIIFCWCLSLAPSCKQGRIESDFLLDLFLSLYFCSRWLLLDRMLCIAVPYRMACLGTLPACEWLPKEKKLSILSLMWPSQQNVYQDTAFYFLISSFSVL